MNVHLIRENENQNDGSYIHLYRNKQIGAWCAYGYSAYGLRLFDKQQGYMNFRSYSDCLQMPCTVTSGESLVSLLQGSVEVSSQTETYIKLKMADTINFNAYQKWLHKLKKDDPNDDAIIVTTHVSQYVPRDSFIPDGMSAFARNVKRIGDFILSLIALIIFLRYSCFAILPFAGKMEEVSFSSKNVSVDSGARSTYTNSAPCVWMPRSSDRSLVIPGVKMIPD